MAGAASKGGGESFKLSLKGTGITVDRTVPEDVALEIVSIVMGGGSGPAGAPPGVPGRGLASRTGQQGMTLRKFLDDANARRIPQIIAAIGQFMTDQEGKARFTRPEVRSKFASAGERAPANIARDFQVAVTSDWIAEDASERGSFYVTDGGRQAIAARFEGQRIRRARRRTPKKGAAKKR
jgi:hypothetical protein